MALLMVGSVGLDTVITPAAKVDDAVGGSLVYGAYAASLFTNPALVGVVGEDFPAKEMQCLRAKGVDTEGIVQVAGGKTFRWGGRYLDDMNQRETLFTDLNVFAEFAPQLPKKHQKFRDIFLANIDPELQLDVLRQARNPRLVVCDTMNLWINTKRASLEKLLKKIHVLLLNDEEARLFSGSSSLIGAAAIIRRRGVERVIIKKGEHGAMMFGPEGAFALPALPLSRVKDPTGAGDTFAGGMVGWIAGKPLTPGNWRKALVVGTALASFCVEDFSVRRLKRLKPEDVAQRVCKLQEMMAVGKVQLHAKEGSAE